MLFPLSKQWSQNDEEPVYINVSVVTVHEAVWAELRHNHIGDLLLSVLY